MKLRKYLERAFSYKRADLLDYELQAAEPPPTLGGVGVARLFLRKKALRKKALFKRSITKECS